MANYDCWVQFFDKDNYDTSHHYGTFLGPNAISDLKDQDWPNTSNNMDGDYSSLKTGPNTWIQVFKDSGYKGDVYTFGPNTCVPVLKTSSKQYDPEGNPIADGPSHDDNFENNISSYKITDFNPVT